MTDALVVGECGGIVRGWDVWNKIRGRCTNYVNISGTIHPYTSSKIMLQCQSRIIKFRNIYVGKEFCPYWGENSSVIQVDSLAIVFEMSLLSAGLAVAG